jgi:hypothetical protein
VCCALGPHQSVSAIVGRSLAEFKKEVEGWRVLWSKNVGQHEEGGSRITKGLTTPRQLYEIELLALLGPSNVGGYEGVHERLEVGPPPLR